MTVLNRSPVDLANEVPSGGTVAARSLLVRPRARSIAQLYTSPTYCWSPTAVLGDRDRDWLWI